MQCLAPRFGPAGLDPDMSLDFRMKQFLKGVAFCHPFETRYGSAFPQYQQKKVFSQDALDASRFRCL